MPVPFAIRKDLFEVEQQLRRIADLLQKVGERPGGTKPHPELTQVAKRLTRIGDSLQKSLSTRGVTPAQVRSIAGNLEAIATLLRKNA